MIYSRKIISILAAACIVGMPLNSALATNENQVQQGRTIEKELPKIYTGQTFIDEISETSMKLGVDYGIYASVMIAQAILESNYGKSALSQSPTNNLFGIKGTYKGQGSSFKTAEDDGSGNLFKIKSKFRQYNSVNQSLEDYANLLKNGLKSSNSFYIGTWKENTNNYSDATAYLQGKYATDTHYAEKLNHLIEKYDLTRFDVDSYARYEADKVIKVVAGDTLKKLAVKYKTTVEELKSWNELETDQINVGQQLIVTIKEIKAIPTKQTAVNKAKSSSTEEKVTKKTKKMVVKAQKPESIVKEIKEETKTKKVVLEKIPQKKVKKKKEIVYKATKYHTVVQGDSITSIAAINNITTKELKKWNKMKDASLTIGEKIIVDIEGSDKKASSAMKQVRYVIQPGDSLASIAAKFNMTEQQLIKVNNLDSVFVYDGQIIKLQK